MPWNSKVPDLKNNPLYLEPRVTGVESQLADVGQQTEMVRQFRSNEVTTRFQPSFSPTFTFVSDDGDIKDYDETVKSVFRDNGIPCVIAAVPGRIESKDPNTMTYAQLKDLQDNYGYEISSHSYSHLEMDSLTEDQIEYEMRESFRLLNANGLKCSTMCVPYGKYNNTVKKIGQKYYRGIRVSGSQVNTLPIKNLEIVSFSTEFENLAACKAKVDEAIAKNTWLVFLFHAWSFKTNPANLQNLIDTVAYIKSKSLPVVTLDEGLNRFANAIDIGANSEYRVNQKGEIFSRQVTSIYLDRDTVNNSNPISDYKQNAVTICPISTAVATSSGFPENKAGIVYVYNFRGEFTGETGYKYREYKVYESNNFYHSYLLSNGTWSAWYNPNDLNLQVTITRPRNTYNGDTLPNALPVGKIIHTSVSAAATGMPVASAGLFIINTTGLTTGGSTDYGYITEEYIKYGTNEKWIRTATSGTAWSAWQKVTVV